MESNTGSSLLPILLHYHQEEPMEVEKVLNLVARVRAIMEYSV